MGRWIEEGFTCNTGVEGCGYGSRDWEHRSKGKDAKVIKKYRKTGAKG